MSQADKSQLRQLAKARRAELAQSEVGAAIAVAGTLLAIIPSAKIIAGYWPVGSELDIRPALVALSSRGDQIALPVTGPAGHVLKFRRWAPEDQLEPGPSGTSHPVAAAPELTPEIVLVPLLAFDRVGHRLGYGAGYYDRTLSVMRGAGQVVTWGIAFDGQEIPVVPAGPHDVRLDGAVTENRVIHFPRETG